MAAINKQYYFLNTDYYEDRPHSATKVMLSNLIKFDYWYCEFKDGLSLGHLKNQDVLDSDTLQKIRNKECHLIINNAHEAFHSVVRYIYKYLVVHLDIDPSYIILITESANINEEIVNQSKLYNKSMINYIWHRLFEYDISKILAGYLPINPSIDFDNINTLQYKYYEKKFINLNRRWRPHRPVFVANLKLMNLLDFGYVSMAKSDDNRDWQFCLDIIEALGPEYSSRFKDQKDIILSIPELKLDQDDMTFNHVYTFTPELISMVENTYFTIVSETSFYNDNRFDDAGIFLSEKIFKPVLFGHPFLVLSKPHTLKYLRTLGYHTFSDIINEDYDNEFDDVKRMDMVLNEVKRLCDLSDVQLKNFLIKANIIGIYNKKLLLKKIKTLINSEYTINPFFSYIENLI